MANGTAQAIDAESEAKARYAEEMADALVVSDVRGKILYVNPAAVRFFGYHETQMKGQQVEMLIPERFREHHAKMLRPDFWNDPRHKEMGISRQIFCLTIDGIEIEATASLTPMWLRAGRVVATAIRRLSKLKPQQD